MKLRSEYFILGFTFLLIGEIVAVIGYLKIREYENVLAFFMFSTSIILSIVGLILIRYGLKWK
ncbi:MAG: hypothetical protein ACKD6N_06340 [Candidatus Bathyarchaeota archaeon]